MTSSYTHIPENDVNKISQTQKDKYHIFFLKWKIFFKVLNSNLWSPKIGEEEG